MVMIAKEVRVQSRMVVERLRRSLLFKEFDEAFQVATGLPLSIISADQVRFALCSKHEKARTTFCSLMAQDGHRCETCRRLHRNIEEEMGISDVKELDSCDVGLIPKRPEIVAAMPQQFGQGPRTFECFAGLCETLVPISVGERLIAFLQTGQVLVHQPTKEEFRRAFGKIEELGEANNFKQLEDAYFDTPVVPADRYRGMVQLLKTFASQLADHSQQILVEDDHREPKIVSYAKSFIRENYDCPLTLEDVAIEVASSPYHLSRRFKETVGITFIEFLSRVRIEKAKELLPNRSKQIGEIAYQVGFRSLAPFNRAFRRFEGMSPKEYRARLADISQ